MSALVAARCLVHPERTASAACVSCRRVGCVECMTRWEGINYCASCLPTRRRGAKSRAGAGPWIAWTLMVASLAAVALILMPFFGVRLAGLFR